MKRDSGGHTEDESAVWSNETSRSRAEDEIDAEIALAALASIECDPSQIVCGVRWVSRCSQAIWAGNFLPVLTGDQKQMGPTLQPGPKRRSLMLIYLQLP